MTPDGLGLKYKPKDHIVFVTSDSTGVDFNAGGKVSIEEDKHIAIPGGGIDLWYRGKDWDPTGMRSRSRSANAVEPCSPRRVERSTARSTSLTGRIG